MVTGEKRVLAVNFTMVHSSSLFMSYRPSRWAGPSSAKLMKLHRMTWQVTCCCLLRIQTLRPLSWANAEAEEQILNLRHRHFAQFKNGWETRPGGKFQPQSNVSLVSSYGMGGTERNWKWPHLLGNKLTRYGQKKIKTLTKLARAFHSRLFIPISRHQLNALEDKIQFNQQFVSAI